MQKTWFRSLGWEDPLAEEIATHSSVLAWRISWTEEPGGLQSMSQRDTTERARARARTHTHTHTVYLLFALYSLMSLSISFTRLTEEPCTLNEEFIIWCMEFSSVQLLSCVRLFETAWTAAHQGSLINSWSLLKLMSIEPVMLSNHLILCCPPLLPPSIFPSIRVFSSESALWIRWPKYWSFNFNISPSNEHPGLISFMMDLLDLLAVQGTLKSLLQHHSSKAAVL